MIARRTCYVSHNRHPPRSTRAAKPHPILFRATYSSIAHYSTARLSKEAHAIQTTGGLYGIVCMKEHWTAMKRRLLSLTVLALLALLGQPFTSAAAPGAPQRDPDLRSSRK